MGPFRRSTSVLAAAAVLSGTFVVSLVSGAQLPPAAAAGSPAPVVVSLTFDDGTADQYQAGDILAQHGMHGTFFVNSGRLGTSGHLTWAQVHALASAGNEIGGHTVSHLNLTTLSTADAQHQVCDDRQALLAQGFTVRSFAYPFGAANPSVEQIVAACGYSSGRIVGDLVSGTNCAGCADAESIPPRDAYRIRTNDSVKSYTTLSDVEGYVTQAQQHGGGLVPLVFHQLCTGSCGTYSTTPALLDGLLSWLGSQASQGTTVETVGDVIAGAEPPKSPSPTPTSPSPTPTSPAPSTSPTPPAPSTSPTPVPTASTTQPSTSPTAAAAATPTTITPAGAPAPLRVSASLAAPTVVTYRSRPAVLVRVTASGSAVPWARITLFFRSRTATSWTRLFVGYANSTGVARFSPLMSSPGILRAYVSGGPTRTPAVAMRAVQIRSYVLVTTPTARVRAGSAVIIGAHLLPRHRGQVVLLQARRSGRWVTVAVRRADLFGRVAYRVVPRPARAVVIYRLVVRPWGTLLGTTAYARVSTR